MDNPINEAMIRRDDDESVQVFKVGDLISIVGYDYIGEIEKINADGTYAIHMKNDSPEHKPSIEGSRLSAAATGKKNGDKAVERNCCKDCIGFFGSICWNSCSYKNGVFECCNYDGIGPCCSCRCWSRPTLDRSENMTQV